MGYFNKMKNFFKEKILKTYDIEIAERQIVLNDNSVTELNASDVVIESELNDSVQSNIISEEVVKETLIDIVIVEDDNVNHGLEETDVFQTNQLQEEPRIENFLDQVNYDIEVTESSDKLQDTTDTKIILTEVMIPNENSEKYEAMVEQVDNKMREVVSEYKDGENKHVITMVYQSTNIEKNEVNYDLEPKLIIEDKGTVINFNSGKKSLPPVTIIKEEIAYETNEVELNIKQVKTDSEADNFLNFLDDEFEADLTKTISSKDFAHRLATSIEVADFKNNKEYIAEYQANSENSKEALDLLVHANIKLVFKIVRRYDYLSTQGYTEEDMFQSGMMGLLKAAEKFDVAKGYEFSTYATWWIRQAITRDIMNNANTVRIPVHMGEKIKKILRLERDSFNRFGEVDYEWIAEEAEMSIDDVLFAIKVNNTFVRTVSLDKPIGAEEDSYLGDFVIDENIIQPEKNAMDKALSEDLRNMLNELKPREKDIIEKRFGLITGEVKTLEAIAEGYDLTRERIRQIEAKALRKLSHPTRKNKLKEYYEHYGTI